MWNVNQTKSSPFFEKDLNKSADIKGHRTWPRKKSRESVVNPTFNDSGSLYVNTSLDTAIFTDFCDIACDIATQFVIGITCDSVGLLFNNLPSEMRKPRTYAARFNFLNQAGKTEQSCMIIPGATLDDDNEIFFFANSQDKADFKDFMQKGGYDLRKVEAITYRKILAPRTRIGNYTRSMAAQMPLKVVLYSQGVSPKIADSVCSFLYTDGGLEEKLFSSAITAGAHQIYGKLMPQGRYIPSFATDSFKLLGRLQRNAGNTAFDFVVFTTEEIAKEFPKLFQQHSLPRKNTATDSEINNSNYKPICSAIAIKDLSADRNEVNVGQLRNSQYYSEVLPRHQFSNNICAIIGSDDLNKCAIVENSESLSSDQLVITTPEDVIAQTSFEDASYLLDGPYKLKSSPEIATPVFNFGFEVHGRSGESVTVIGKLEIPLTSGNLGFFVALVGLMTAPIFGLNYKNKVEEKTQGSYDKVIKSMQEIDKGYKNVCEKIQQAMQEDDLARKEQLLHNVFTNITNLQDFIKQKDNNTVERNEHKKYPIPDELYQKAREYCGDLYTVLENTRQNINISLLDKTNVLNRLNNNEYSGEGQRLLLEDRYSLLCKSELNQAIEAGDYEQIILSCDDLLRYQDGDFDLLFRRTHAYLDLKKYDDALNTFLVLSKQQSQSGDNPERLRKIQFLQQQLCSEIYNVEGTEGVIEFYKKILHSMPDNIGALKGLAKMYCVSALDTGQNYEQAQKCCDEVLSRVEDKDTKSLKIYLDNNRLHHVLKKYENKQFVVAGIRLFADIFEDFIQSYFREYISKQKWINPAQSIFSTICQVIDLNYSQEIENIFLAYLRNTKELQQIAGSENIQNSDTSQEALLIVRKMQYLFLGVELFGSTIELMKRYPNRFPEVVQMAVRKLHNINKTYVLPASSFGSTMLKGFCVVDKLTKQPLFEVPFKTWVDATEFFQRFFFDDFDYNKRHSTFRLVDRYAISHGETILQLSTKVLQLMRLDNETAVNYILRGAEVLPYLRAFLLVYKTGSLISDQYFLYKQLCQISNDVVQLKNGFKYRNNILMSLERQVSGSLQVTCELAQLKSGYNTMLERTLKYQRQGTEYCQQMVGQIETRVRLGEQQLQTMHNRVQSIGEVAQEAFKVTEGLKQLEETSRQRREKNRQVFSKLFQFDQNHKELLFSHSFRNKTNRSESKNDDKTLSGFSFNRR